MWVHTVNKESQIIKDWSNFGPQGCIAKGTLDSLMISYFALCSQPLDSLPMKSCSRSVRQWRAFLRLRADKNKPQQRGSDALVSNQRALGDHWKFNVLLLKWRREDMASKINWSRWSFLRVRCRVQGNFSTPLLMETLTTNFGSEEGSQRSQQTTHRL